MDSSSYYNHQWRSRLKRRRGNTFKAVVLRELNLVAMMDVLTIILVFLLKSYSVSAMSLPVGEEINVPYSSHLLAPPEAVKLTVTKIGGSEPGVIAVDEERIFLLDKAKRRELFSRSKRRRYLIPELHKALLKKAKGIKYIASKNPQVKFEGKILVIADKNTPYWLVTQVLYTAAEAEFDRYNLVALRENQ